MFAPTESPSLLLDFALFLNKMEVRILGVQQSFPDGPTDDSTGPHDSLKPLLDIVDESTKSDVVKYRFLGDARREQSSAILIVNRDLG